MTTTRTADTLHALLALMARLRDPATGCAWDVEQNFATIAPYTIEEAYEVADAIARNDMRALKEELGDALLQVVFHAQMASEAGLFDFADVAETITQKMIARHPHVFGDAEVRTADEQVAAWEVQKQAERDAKNDGKPTSVLDDVPLALPALMRAQKLGKRAASTGFDWPDLNGALEKLQEEVAELMEAKGNPAEAFHELGDVLFACTNIARHMGVDAEDALRATNQRFSNRFQHVERTLHATGTPMKSAGLEQMEALWQEAKQMEKQA